MHMHLRHLLNLCGRWMNLSGIDQTCCEFFHGPIMFSRNAPSEIAQPMDRWKLKMATEEKWKLNMF